MSLTFSTSYNSFDLSSWISTPELIEPSDDYSEIDGDFTSDDDAPADKDGVPEDGDESLVDNSESAAVVFCLCSPHPISNSRSCSRRISVPY